MWECDEECDYRYVTVCSARNWVYHPYFVLYNNLDQGIVPPTLKTWLRPCHWLPIRQRVIFNDCCTWKCIHVRRCCGLSTGAVLFPVESVQVVHGYCLHRPDLSITTQSTDVNQTAEFRCQYGVCQCETFVGDRLYKNSPGDEIANVNFYAVRPGSYPNSTK